jgi:hypothetical protein
MAASSLMRRLSHCERHGTIVYSGSARQHSARLLATLACVAVLSNALPLAAESPSPRVAESDSRRTVPEGTGDRAVRAEASQAIPYNRLRPEVAKQIHSVVSQPTVFRRLPVTTIDCDPNLFVFLVRNPEVVIGIWELMGVTQIDLQRTGEFRYRAHDGMGTVSETDLVYGTPDLHLYYGRGVYEGPLFKAKIFGECVMLLRTIRYTGPSGRSLVKNVLDVFMKLDSPTVNLVARTFHPLFVKTADINFVETSNFLMKLSKTAELNPAGIVELSNQLPNVSGKVSREFGQLAENVAHENRAKRITTVARPIAANHEPLDHYRRTSVTHASGVETSRLHQPGVLLR